MLALCIALVAVAPVGFAASPGTQCPTAAVKLVRIPVTDCCKRTVGYVVRAPKPNEKGFVQCQCSEKRAAVQKAFVVEKAPFILTNAAIVAIAEMCVPCADSFSYDVACGWTPTRNLLKPPTCS